MDTETTPPTKAALLTDKQMAVMLGISARQIWKLASSGKMPKPIKIGGSTRWRRSEVDAFVAGLAAN